jgi:hypothetical protein
MKRYLTGILAMIIAVCAAAFTQPVKHADLVPFIYTPPMPGDYSQASVQDKDNWDPGSATCSASDQRACTLEVTSAHTTSGGTELNSDVTITATQGTLAGNYAVSGGTNISDFQNKQ